MTGRVLAACVVAEEVPSGSRHVPVTAIDKRPVDGPVVVFEQGLECDYVCDTGNHGGPDRAVYLYGQTEADRWAGELGRPLPYGWFGENLRVEGFEPTDAVIGTRLRIGEQVELEITAGRVPCGVFGFVREQARWVKRFTERGDVGAFTRVLVPGALRAGDPIRVVEVPAHGVTIRDVFTGHSLALLDRLEAEQPHLSDSTLERIAFHRKRAAMQRGA